jgi:hypothetical protein
MKPIFQDRFGFPEGNCTEAALASILECPLSDVPDLRETPEEGMEWVVALNEWLVPTYGLCLVFFGSNWGDVPYPPGWVLFSGMGPRGLGHMVVGFDGEVRHDPHPDVVGVEIYGIGILVVLDPSSRS